MVLKLTLSNSLICGSGAVAQMSTRSTLNFLDFARTALMRFLFMAPPTSIIQQKNQLYCFVLEV